MSWYHFGPEIITALTVLAILLVELLPDGRRPWLGYLAHIGFAAALVADIALLVSGANATYFNGGFRLDALAGVFKAILLASAALVCIATAKGSESGSVSERGEFYLLLSLSALGALLMASASDLLVLFIALELTVLPSYALAALKRDERSTEAAVKYFLLGMIASAVFLYGASLVFGLTGSITFAGIAEALGRDGVSPALVIGLVTLLAGLGFKVAAVPFHFWAPDVYEGADVSVASYLAVGPKAGGFAAIARLFPVAFGGAAAAWSPLFAVVAVASMFLGNLTALSQSSVRRLLGYSGIAHTGYLLVGLAVVEGYARDSLAFYFLVYSAATLGAFLVVLAASSTVGERVEDYAGLSRRAPGLAFAMALFLFSLVGLPPLAGFIGKFYLFSSAVKGGLVWLAVVGVVNSVISLGYYSSIIRQMYLVKPVTVGEVSVAWPLKLTIYALVAAVVVIGAYPSIVLSIFKF